MTRPRIALVATKDPTSPALWSGTPHFMAQALDKVAELTIVTALPVSPRALILKARQEGVQHLLGLQEFWLTDPRYLRTLAQALERQLKQHRKFDGILAYSTAPAAFLDYNAPLAVWPDALFPGMVNYYPEFSHLSVNGRLNGLACDESALGNSDLFLAPSQWAMGIADSMTVPHRSELAPYGANLPGSLSLPTMPRERPRPRPRLLTIGVDWDRKQMDLIVEATSEARKMTEQEIQLTIVGCQPPQNRLLPDYVRIVGRLSKWDPIELAQLHQEFLAADAFILASRAECYGIVLCEAAAYGLPLIGSDTGGIPSILSVAGSDFSFSSESVEMAAVAISSVFSDVSTYAEASESAITAYRKYLNWDSAAHRAVSIAIGGEYDRIVVPRG